jgi:hypothetical protein
MWLRAVLLVADVFHPVDDLAVEHLGDCDVGHRRSRRGAVPVPFARLEPYKIASM